MKLTHQLLSLTLALILVLGSVACAKGETETETTGQDKREDVTNEEVNGESLGIEMKDYGITAKFMTRDAGEWSTVDIYQETESSTPIPSAVFTRNIEVQELYGIKVEEWQVKDTSSEVNKLIKSNDQDYSAIVGQLADIAALASKGSFYDLYDLPSVDLTKSWWDQKAVEGLSIANHVFYATGDLLTSDNDATFILMFNKTIMKNADLLGEALPDVNAESLYDLVNNKEWTLEAMLNLATAATKEMGGDPNELDPYEDRIGFAMTGNVAFSLLYGGGVVITAKNEDDIPEYQLTTSAAKEHADAVISAAYKLYGNKNITFNMELDHEGNGVVQNGKDCFGNGHALFLGECLQVVIRLRSHDVDFGVIPYPLYNSSQESYYSYMNSAGGMVAIPNCLTEENAEKASIAIEVLAAKSQNTLTPAYYDTTLIGKSTKDPESEPMIDMILSTRVYDLAYVYGWANAVSSFANLISTGKGVASASRNMERRLSSAIDKALKSMNIE